MNPDIFSKPRLIFLHKWAFLPHETSAFTHRNRFFLKTLSRVAQGSVYTKPGNKICG